MHDRSRQNALGRKEDQDQNRYHQDQLHQADDLDAHLIPDSCGLAIPAQAARQPFPPRRVIYRATDKVRAKTNLELIRNHYGSRWVCAITIIPRRAICQRRTAVVVQAQERTVLPRRLGMGDFVHDPAIEVYYC